MSDLRELFDRQVEHLRRQQGERLLLLLPRFVRSVVEEPRLHAIVEDIVADYFRGLDAFAEADREMAASLNSLWEAHRTWFLQAWEAEVAKNPSNPAWQGWGGSPVNWPQLLANAGKHELPKFTESENPSATGRVLGSIQHWIKCVEEGEVWKSDTGRADELAAGVRQVDSDHDRAHRLFLIINRSHPGAAWTRIRAFAASLVPPPEEHSAGDDFWAILNQYARSLDQLRVSNSALGLAHDDHAKGDVGQYCRQITQDLEVLAEEVDQRIGRHLSRRALVRRFKTRCERFDAAPLRAAIAAEPARKPEDILTLAAARYLYDQGLNPLFNAPIVKLRPDLFDAAGPFSFYLEAKQYTANPKKVMKQAARQMWDTWNELDGQHDVREAFLMVFRRAGPLAVFDFDFTKSGARTLYPIVIDIADTAKKGSRGTKDAVHMKVADLLPKDGAE